MKILFLANRVPYPPYRGDKLKIYNLAKRLKANHEIHLLTFAQTKEDLTYKAELEKIFDVVNFVYLPKWKSAIKCLVGAFSTTPFQVLYFQSSKLRNELDEMLEVHKYDAVHVQHLRMSPYLANYKEVPRILDLPDAFSLYWERRRMVNKGVFATIFEKIEQKRVLASEAVLKEYNLALVCSNEDLDYLEIMHHSGNLRLLPNGVDRVTFAPRNHDYSHNETILFTGNMDYAPNVDAVIHFAENIFPIVRAEFPKAKFVIAGQRPVKKVLALANDHIVVTGFIKNLADAYDSASVLVAPLRFGAGTQNKVLEAMSMGIPVVCTQIGFNGLGTKSGEAAIMQRDPESFARSVIDVLASEELRRTLGTGGAKLVKERFDWDTIADTLEGYLKECGMRRFS